MMTISRTVSGHPCKAALMVRLISFAIISASPPLLSEDLRVLLLRQLADDRFLATHFAAPRLRGGEEVPVRPRASEAGDFVRFLVTPCFLVRASRSLRAVSCAAARAAEE